MHLFDSIEIAYIKRKGWRINSDGILVLSAHQAKSEPYLGRNIRNPEQRTLMVPSERGCTLLFEGKHFIVAK